MSAIVSSSFLGICADERHRKEAIQHLTSQLFSQGTSTSQSPLSYSLQWLRELLAFIAVLPTVRLFTPSSNNFSQSGKLFTKKCFKLSTTYMNMDESTCANNARKNIHERVKAKAKVLNREYVTLHSCVSRWNSQLRGQLFVPYVA